MLSSLLSPFSLLLHGAWTSRAHVWNWPNSQLLLRGHRASGEQWPWQEVAKVGDQAQEQGRET